MVLDSQNDEGMILMTDDDDDDDDDDSPLVLRQKSSMHSMLVAQGRGDIKISKSNKSITCTNVRRTLSL